MVIRRIKLINPYRPGAGTKPLVLAGRDQDLEEVAQIFETLRLNIPTQSIIYSGLRGEDGLVKCAAGNCRGQGDFQQTHRGGDKK